MKLLVTTVSVEDAIKMLSEKYKFVSKYYSIDLTTKRI